MGYVIIPEPHVKELTVIVAVLTGRGHLCDLSRKAPPGAVVNNRVGDLEFTMIFGCFSRST